MSRRNRTPAGSAPAEPTSQEEPKSETVAPEAQPESAEAPTDAPAGSAPAESTEDAAAPAHVEPPSDPADASLDGDDAEDDPEPGDPPAATEPLQGAVSPTIADEPPPDGKVVRLSVAKGADPALAEAFAPPPPASRRFKLGGLGTLQCDGVVYHPGDALPFTEARLVALGILHLAVPVED